MTLHDMLEKNPIFLEGGQKEEVPAPNPFHGNIPKWPSKHDKFLIVQRKQSISEKLMIEIKCYQEHARVANLMTFLWTTNC